MLSRLRIGPKLLLAPGLVLLLLIMLSSGAYLAMLRQNTSLETIVQQRAVHLRDTAALSAEAHHAHTEIYRLLSWKSASFSRARVDELIRSIHQRHNAIGGRFGALTSGTEAGSAERRCIEQAETAHGMYVKAVLDVIEMSRFDQSVSTNAMSKAESAFDAVALRLAELWRLEQQLSEQASNRAAADFKTVSTVMPIVIALSIALSLLITLAVRRALLREVREIGDAAFDLASGNLTVKDRVYGKDEIAQTSRALDTSIRGLNATLRTIFESARSIDSASREIALGNADLSSRAEAQASSLELTASSMEELTATVGKTASKALVANRLAASASSYAVKGGDVVEWVVATMASIKGRSDKVVQIAGTIDALAGRTALLASSAAGGSAAEVRMLARRSAAAAREIKELIAQSVAEIDGGSASVSEAGDNMNEIAASVQQVGDLIAQISCASAAQASGIQGVSQAIVQVDQMTQQNSALVVEAAAAAARLQQQANSLARAVAGFRLDEAMLQGAPLPDGVRPVVRGHLRLASSRA